MNDVIAWIKGHRWETVSGVLGVGLIVALVSLVAVAGGEEESVSTSTTVLSTTTTVPPTTVAPTTTSTQAGEVGSTTTVVEADVGVTAVVVDNVPDVGFQIGLNGADLLIEIPVEGGLSRFTAMYGVEVPDIVGPVRSLRPVSADLLAPFDPVVFTTGGQPFVVGAVTAAGATLVTPEESIAFQSLERPQPYHVFVSPGTEGHQGVEFVAPWEVGAWKGGDPAAEVAYPVAGGVTWRYEDDAYVRYRGEEAQEILARVDGEAEILNRQTLILLAANQKSAGYTDSNDVEVPTFDVVGGGELYVLHAGEVIEGSWFRGSQAEDYVFSDEEGDPLLIPEGELYLGVVPTGQEIVLGG